MRLFTEKQLQVLHDCAIACAASKTGELSVFKAAEQANTKESIFTPEELHIIWFCAEECRRQDEPDGEMCVYRYILTWDAAYTMSLESKAPTQDDDHELACLNSPDQNNQYRYLPARFRNGEVAMEPESISRAMRCLFNMGGFNDLGPQESYVRYEEIHPRINGNGRIGKILFNWLRGTLARPEFPVEPRHFKKAADPTQ